LDNPANKQANKQSENLISLAEVSTDYQNRLPEDIRAEPDITNFRKLLKTHYFNSAFNVQ